MIESLLDKAYPDKSDAFFKGYAGIIMNMTSLLCKTENEGQLLECLKDNFIDEKLYLSLRKVKYDDAMCDTLHPFLKTLFPAPSLKVIERRAVENTEEQELLVDTLRQRHLQYIESELYHGLHEESLYLLKRIARQVITANHPTILKEGH